ncbi:MAG TPA: xanthine dehydrogenase accessory protein XdhC [bacterium]|nr:xanthine dehydrogenase accessory protein XdhC [Myxococcales bacterium]OQA58719.1 MAG: putative xanthine dehydrogenase subunit A [bacterium ADurb.Bin270]HPW44996.1 xanthine dehydrogenase accessory protein XdhC [bacterium]
MDIDAKAMELKKAGIAFCIATVVRVEGSAPRHAGSKMIVAADGNIFGTVGGGGVEHQAIEDAKYLLKTKTAECVSYDLTGDGIQPCGGRVEIFFESVAPLSHVVVFGAGHIAEKLCPMLVEMDFDLTLVDERSERLSLSTFSSIEKKSSLLPLDFLSSFRFDDEVFMICLTHKHIHDEAIVEYCLDKPFKYFGLISSRKKWALFCQRYREKGFSDDQMRRISTPIGLDIGAETPFEIAVAIAAEIIQFRTKPEDFKARVARFK